MAVEWVDVADSTVKIGLGSVIALITTCVTLKVTHRHEFKKELIAQRRKELDVKTERYINFLSSSRMMLQKHKFASFQHDSHDYIEYIRLHEIISVTAENDVRIHAFDTFSSVDQAITMGTAERVEKKPIHDKAQEALQIFQVTVNSELRKEKESIEKSNTNLSFWKFWRW